MDILEKSPELFGLMPLSDFPKQPSLREDCLADFHALKESAKSEGIELELISGVREFDKQKAIWNAKASGKRELLNDQGRPLEFKSLSEEEVLKAILRWSALPGLSRHHWGTDGDIIDSKALKAWQEENPDYQVELSPGEYESNGPFESLGNFLNDHLENFHFFRPYREDLGGVAPEPWHISHRFSLTYKEIYTFDVFNQFLQTDHYKDLLLRELVLEKAEWIFENYFLNITGPQRP